MRGGVHYGGVEGLDSVERWSWQRCLCVVECTMGCWGTALCREVVLAEVFVRGGVHYGVLGYWSLYRVGLKSAVHGTTSGPWGG